MGKHRPTALIGIGSLLFALMSIPAHAIIINVNAVTNSLSNPLDVFLSAGDYLVEPVGVAQGGTYNSWNAWGSTSCTASTGCTPGSATGWLDSYDVTSPSITGVEVAGVSLSPVSTDQSTATSYFVVAPGDVRYHVGWNLVYPTDILALANAKSSSFTVSTSGNVGFFILDSPNSDNLGGMSLRISAIAPPPPRPVPEPATLALLGLGLAGIGYQRRKQTSA